MPKMEIAPSTGWPMAAPLDRFGPDPAHGQPTVGRSAFRRPSSTPTTGGTIDGMAKTTVHLPVKSESSTHPERDRTLPTFNSGRSRTAEAMDDAVYLHVKQQAARR